MGVKSGEKRGGGDPERRPAIYKGGGIERR